MKSNKCGRILIVDDQDNWRNALKGLLIEDGHFVTTATSYDNVLVKLSKNQYDLIILDIRLVDNDPFNMQGLELLRIAKNQKNHPRVMILTGYYETNVESELESFGADDMILKVPSGSSFDTNNFKKTAQRLINEGKSNKSAHSKT